MRKQYHEIKSEHKQAHTMIANLVFALVALHGDTAIQLVARELKLERGDVEYGEKRQRHLA